MIGALKFRNIPKLAWQKKILIRDFFFFRNKHTHTHTQERGEGVLI